MGQVFTKVMGPPLVEDPQDVLVQRRGVVWNVDGTMKSCLFCGYASGTGDETMKLLYEDDLVVAFPPPKTAAKQHFLVIPRQHITTVGDLFVSDVHVLNRMRSVAEDLLKKETAGLAAESMQFSFHVPPWNSIDHLHLHAFELPFNSLWDRMKFAEGKPWCAGHDNVCQWVSTSPDQRDDEYYPTPTHDEGRSTPGDEQKEPIAAADAEEKAQYPMSSADAEKKEQYPMSSAEEQA